MVGPGVQQQQIWNQTYREERGFWRGDNGVKGGNWLPGMVGPGSAPAGQQWRFTAPRPAGVLLPGSRGGAALHALCGGGGARLLRAGSMTVTLGYAREKGTLAPSPPFSRHNFDRSDKSLFFPNTNSGHCVWWMHFLLWSIMYVWCSLEGRCKTHLAEWHVVGMLTDLSGYWCITSISQKVTRRFKWILCWLTHPRRKLHSKRLQMVISKINFEKAYNKVERTFLP
jgi:hypothetical protein